jgi:hypothetical protein
MKKTVFILVMVLGTTIINAQPRFRYAPGVNFSTLRIKQNGINYSSARPMTIHIGGLWDMQMTRHLWLEPGFQFTAKGSDYTIDSIRKSLTPLYFEVPINAEYRFNIKNVKLSLFSGLFIGCGIGGYIIDNDINREIRYGSSENDDMRRIDYGINVGTGLEVRKIFLAVQYSYGLANFAPVRANDTELKSDLIGVTLIFR